MLPYLVGWAVRLDGMSQSIYGKFQGRDNSCTSGEAASAGIENSPRVTKGLSQFPKNGLAGVVK